MRTQYTYVFLLFISISNIIRNKALTREKSQNPSNDFLTTTNNVNMIKKKQKENNSIIDIVNKTFTTYSIVVQLLI